MVVILVVFFGGIDIKSVFFGIDWFMIKMMVNEWLMIEVNEWLMIDNV